MSKPILVIGEALIDAVSDGVSPTREHVGGSPANVAFGLAALDHDVQLATDIGADEHGYAILEACRRHGVSVLEGSVGDRPTSVAHARLDTSGGATYVFEIAWEPPAVPDPTAYGHVHTGSIAGTLLPGADTVLDVVRAVREDGTVSYDPNARPSLMESAEAVVDQVETLISVSDVVKASDEDIAWLYPGSSVPEILRRWAALGALVTIVTRGGEGAIVSMSHGEATSVPAAPSEVIDTVGAGDSFMAGLISGLLDAGLLGSLDARERLAAATLADIRPAVERALATAAVTVAHAGAYAPGRPELSPAPTDQEASSA